MSLTNIPIVNQVREGVGTRVLVTMIHIEDDKPSNVEYLVEGVADNCSYKDFLIDYPKVLGFLDLDNCPLKL